MFKVKPPKILRKLFRALVWNYPKQEHDIIYLTFDDGPCPEVTPWILETLRKADVKATFFCVGMNVEEYPDLYYQILKEGHVVGNHSYSHLKGFRANILEYLEDVEKAAYLINSKLFRPPYGKIRPSQMRLLKNKFKIIIWDVMSCDYDQNISGEKCLENVIKNAKSGSIIVFHDSLKAKENMMYALPRAIDHFKKKGYQFMLLD
ncbi:MAG: polysaccharide deacetylase family protein [Bacteroidota bacterium]|nr:polysaccharide deacetylase family protein [Bacteroidota bacterium]MDP4225840.1 polysaccharide deacetylase family protein [Bacteroidota bacterium]MDP4273199.1 polysaccharide deacetylase family protein [Bacteroidota bacterium]